jgi:murein tripeptide amidase MpaA
MEGTLMRRSHLLYGLVVAVGISCAPASPNPSPVSGSALACCAEQGHAISARYRVPAITQRRFTHAELWAVLDPIVRSPALRTTEIGRSIQGRPIRAITFGTGQTTVLLWSQMHGDESTATMALADIFAWLAASGNDATRDRLERALTITVLPMLNPDGAER